MAPSPDYKPHKDQKKWPALFYPYIGEAAWLDYQYRFGDTLGNLD